MTTVELISLSCILLASRVIPRDLCKLADGQARVGQDGQPDPDMMHWSDGHPDERNTMKASHM